MLLRKIVLFIIGYALYISIEVTFRGYSFVLMGICGGLLFLAIDEINERISWDTDILLQGCIGSAMITGCELVVGELNKYFGGFPMWDYSNMWFNFDGVICLEYSLIWIGLSIVAVVVADAINYYMFRQLPIPYYKLFGKQIFKFKEI